MEFCLWGVLQYRLIGVFVCFSDQNRVATAFESFYYLGYLFRRFTLAKDDLRPAGAQSTVVIQLGEPDILIR